MKIVIVIRSIYLRLVTSIGKYSGNIHTLKKEATVHTDIYCKFTYKFITFFNIIKFVYFAAVASFYACDTKRVERLCTAADANLDTRAFPSPKLRGQCSFWGRY